MTSRSRDPPFFPLLLPKAILFTFVTRCFFTQANTVSVFFPGIFFNVYGALSRKLTIFV